jgi:predicted RNA-binding Zn ribbon-like protein
MTSRLVDGRYLPAAVAGHPALELCNTRAGWGTASPKEYLVDFTALALWARETRLMSPTETRAVLRSAAAAPRRARASLSRAIELREALYAAVTAPRADSLDAVRGFVLRAAGRSQYRRLGGGLLLDGGSGLPAIVDRAALQAHRLLEQFGAEAVGRCGGVGCGWLFLDPVHRRRWCTMTICGNRAKARRYAQRRRTFAS